MAAKRKPLIAGNWKMNGLTKDARTLGWRVGKTHGKEQEPSVRITNLSASTIVGPLRQCREGLGHKGRGAGLSHCGRPVRTPAMSVAPLLRDMGCGYVIVGHSDVADHGETASSQG